MVVSNRIRHNQKTASQPPPPRERNDVGSTFRAQPWGPSAVIYLYGYPAIGAMFPAGLFVLHGPTQDCEAQSLHDPVKTMRAKRRTHASQILGRIGTPALTTLALLIVGAISPLAVYLRFVRFFSRDDGAEPNGIREFAVELRHLQERLTLEEIAARKMVDDSRVRPTERALRPSEYGLANLPGKPRKRRRGLVILCALTHALAPLRAAFRIRAGPERNPGRLLLDGMDGVFLRRMTRAIQAMLPLTDGNCMAARSGSRRIGVSAQPVAASPVNTNPEIGMTFCKNEAIRGGSKLAHED